MINKIKSDPVLVISGILAVVSCIIVPPDIKYLDYINFRVLAILGALMLVVGALSDIGTFDYLTSKMLGKVGNRRSASLILVLLSFILSMFMTNDVTLVTLVPFAVMAIGAFGDDKNLMYTLIFMTCAANLGSMLTPVGNPQNLYLYSHYEMHAGHFFLLMLPYTLASLVMVVLGIMLTVKKSSGKVNAGSKPKPPVFSTIVCIIMFVVALLTVLGLLHYLIMLATVCVVIFVLDRKAYAKVDYSLLITFIFFFVLIGNIGRIGPVYDTLSSLVDGHTVITAVLSSQIISNVPAAMLLSAFTSNGDGLLIGTNLGGLGTLIASMASLITYKIYIRDHKKGSASYIAAFSVVNVIMLVLLVAGYYVSRLF
jgi:Na+/H+ antiporter NhaD/arsenite permease-like protein